MNSWVIDELSAPIDTIFCAGATAARRLADLGLRDLDVDATFRDALIHPSLTSDTAWPFSPVPHHNSGTQTPLRKEELRQSGISVVPAHRVRRAAAVPPGGKKPESPRSPGPAKQIGSRDRSGQADRRIQGTVMALKPSGFEMSPGCCSDDKRRVGGVRGVEGLEEENRSPRRLFPESLRRPPGAPAHEVRQE